MEKQIDEFERKLIEGDFSNLNYPLFDLSDKRIRSVYQKLQTDTKAEAISRDTTSWEEIKECVEAHVSQYGDGALVIISGAARHIWGAIPYLEQRVGARYVSATSNKLSIDLVANEDTMIELDKETKKDEERKALNSIQVQMKRDLGVVRNLGYDTIEAYLADRENVQNPRNVIFGAEETGLHRLCFGERTEQLYKVLLDFVKEAKPKTILYISEDLNVEGTKNNFENGKPSLRGNLPRDEIFDYAKSQGIPVKFGAFGHKCRQSEKSFGRSEIEIFNNINEQTIDPFKDSILRQVNKNEINSFKCITERIANIDEDMLAKLVEEYNKLEEQKIFEEKKPKEAEN